MQPEHLQSAMQKHPLLNNRTKREKGETRRGNVSVCTAAQWITPDRSRVQTPCAVPLLVGPWEREMQTHSHALQQRVMNDSKGVKLHSWRETYFCASVCLCGCKVEGCLAVVPGKMTSSLMKRPAEGLPLCGEWRISNCLPATVIAKRRTGPLYHWIFVKQPLTVADSIINLTIWTKGPTQ